MRGSPETGRIIKPGSLPPLALPSSPPGAPDRLRRSPIAPSVPCADHLVNVITASAMDYLIVLGDRNMRNETCQSRGNGRLMEVPVAERVRALLRDWADTTGLAISKRPSGRGHVQDSQEVAALSEPELWDTFRRYTGSRLGYDRVSKLRDVRRMRPSQSLSCRLLTPLHACCRAQLREILQSWGRTRKTLDPELDASLSLSESDRATVSGVSPSLLAPSLQLTHCRVAQATRLTKAQTAMVKLHEDVRQGKRMLRQLPTFHPVRCPRERERNRGRWRP